VTRTKVIVVLASLFAGAVAATSCQLVAGLDWSLGAADGGAGDAMMQPETGPPACGGASYPPPPGGPDMGPDVGTIVVAIRSVNFGDMGGTPPGYDLDHTCTCIDGGGPSCTGRSSVPATYCDAPGGIDDQTRLLIQLIQASLGAGNFGSDFFTQEATEGRWSLLIEITGYNGTENDPVVEVALYPSPGFVANDAGAPAWNGTDAWNVSSSSLVPGDGGLVARYASNGAYVSNGTLVASFPQSEIVFRGGSASVFQIELSEGVLTGTLVKQDTALGVQWSLEDGILAARWALSDIFNDFASYRDDNGDPICTGTIGYNLAKSAICNDADILVNASEPESTPCDALSFGLGFTADPANVGPVEDAGASPDGGCAPGTSPAGDMCPPP
jgi:hypothetical protein